MGTVGQYLGQKGPVINQHDVSDEYRSRYAETFGKSPRERWLEEGREDETFEEWRARTEPKRKGYVKVLLTNQLDPRENGVRLVRTRDLPPEIRDSLPRRKWRGREIPIVHDGRRFVVESITSVGAMTVRGCRRAP